MLALTPEPLQTAGERALFAELTRWDTGGAVRSAVVASLPLVDGPMDRRISDAVLFVPEGLAVVRIAEVPKQHGVVTAVPEGAWSIAPDARPGEVLQIAGGGSSPLDGLMRAGMEAAVRLRSAGLEPGRIARLTVLVGDLTGLVPADGDLGEGDQVALLEPRSLLLGVARAARYAGVGNPRLWTTADVRAALEVLGVPGRGPSVEELNGEGFPYSPYVLRKRELLTPAAMNAASVAPPAPPALPAAPAVVPVAAVPVAAVPVAAVPVATAAPVPAAPVTGGFVAPTPGGPRVDPAAAAAVAVAAIRADEAAAAHRAAAYAPGPVTGQAPPAAEPAEHPTTDETGGIGGLFAGAEHTDSSARSAPAAQPATLVGPTVTAPHRGTPLLDRPQSEWPAGPGAAVEHPPAARPPGTPRVVARRRPDRTRRLALLGGGAALVVLLVVLGLVVVLGGGGEDAGDEQADTTPLPSSAAPGDDAGPAVGAQATLDGIPFTLEHLQADDGCADHAYGSVADFFARTDCAGMTRALWSTQVDGRDVVVSIAVVDMGQEGLADALRALADTSGSGNVNDLLLEGVGYPGGPDGFTRSRQYASAVGGTTVRIVETDWVEAEGSAPDLDRVAATALALEMPDPTP
ncbi:hypothetical protein [Trujillonella humicola]|uniref:hypothetical protein n=1 Tax=Trujillonella humicola TaxID=3383699 RepID=UPI003905D828